MFVSSFFFTLFTSFVIETDYQINQPMYNCLIDHENIPVWWVEGNLWHNTIMNTKEAKANKKIGELEMEQEGK